MTEHGGVESTELGVPPEVALDMLRIALEGTATGVWVWDLETDTVRRSPNQGELHGRGRGATPISYGEWLSEWVHDDDRERVDRTIERGLAELSGYEFEFRSRGDPSRWLYARGHVIRHDDGKARAVVGLTLDVTERHERDSERELLTRRLNGVQVVTDAALDHLELEALLHELLARVAALLDADIAKIMLYDERRATLVTRASLGLPDEVVGTLRIPVGTGVAGQVVLRDAPGILSDEELADAALAELRESGRAVAGAPLRVAGETLGVLVIASRDRVYAEEDLLLLELVADRCARAIRQSELYEAAREAALSLQRSLLPASLPAVPGLDVAARYLPGQDGTEVGGDWYDLFTLADGRVALVVGDVVGRGLRAAARMGTIRTALRAYALEAPAPSIALSRLDRFVALQDPVEFTTVLVAFIAPATGHAQLASAGHLPPVLVDEDGARPLETPADPPVGMAVEPRRDLTLHLAADATLIGFTDGLVENRATGLEPGMRRLCELPRPGDAARVVVDRLVDELATPDGGDDIAILAARRVGARLERTFDSEVSAVAVARHEVVAFASARGAPESVLRDLALAVSEACTNVVVHAYRDRPADAAGPMHVRAWVDGDALEVSIADEGCGVRPRRDSPGVGLGLGIIARTTDEFEVRDAPEGGGELRLRFRLNDPS
jgi:PAS domain S-box-containing protein